MFRSLVLVFRSGVQDWGSGLGFRSGVQDWGSGLGLWSGDPGAEGVWKKPGSGLGVHAGVSVFVWF